MICDFLAQEIERVGRIGMVARVVGEVAGHIDVDEIDGFLTDIDGVHGFGTATQGVEGEAAGVAEHIEDVFPFGVTLYECTVLSLVDKETCLLSPQPIDAELQAVFGRPEVFVIGDW